MKVESLRLTRFRNIQDATIEFGPDLNFFVGKNGQGKTSILEALNYLATLHSFRGADTFDVIQNGERQAVAECRLSWIDPNRETWWTDLKVDFSVRELESQRATKQAWINQKPVRSSTQYLAQRFQNAGLGFHAIAFNPEDHELVRGEPKIRRNYLNQVLSGEDFNYLQALKAYQRALDQRNALLRAAQGQSRSAMRSNELEGFTEQLIQLGAKLALKRLEWLERLSVRLEKVLHSLAPNQSAPRLIYASKWAQNQDLLNDKNSRLVNKLGPVHFAGQYPLPSLQELERKFALKLAQLAEAELQSGTTLVGVHRDDWMLLLGDELLKQQGSQGEIRAALLALKLSEIQLFQECTGQNPVLLLDDFSSELDYERRRFLLDHLVTSQLQVFVTTTEAGIFSGNRYWVMSGNVQKNEDSVHESKPALI